MKIRELPFGIWGISSLFFITSLPIFASRPDCEKSLAEVTEAVTQSFGSPLEYSTSSLIPLMQLIASHKDPYLIWLHANGQIHQREFPTPGLAQMYRTASTASDSLLEHLEEKAVRPEYRAGDLFSGAAQTEELMMNPAKQPLYIRDGVLVRDGVVMVVPLLKRLEAGKKPLYMPIMAKGHQDLREEDKLAAAFAAWALGDVLGQIPAKAKIYLKPMVDPRKPGKKNARKQKNYEEFNINVQDHLPEVEGIHADYIHLMTNPEAMAALKARRTPQLMKNPYAVYTREKLDSIHDLSMMPYPPKRSQVLRMQAMGYESMQQLAAVKINSPQFFEISVVTGIKPERLRRFVAHSVARKKDNPIILSEYEDPFKGATSIVHVDFEDLMSRDFRSGVYLFGARVEDPKSRKKDKVASELFRFAEKLDQGSMEDAWADFIRFFKKDPRLKKGDYLISVYSHHELTKFAQEFDILKQKAEEFSPSQRRSPYYREVPGTNMGWFIRNNAFFRKYPDLKPADIFAIMDRVVDLYGYVLTQFAFPTYSNGLKHILDYVVRSQDLKLDYPEGWNGLESIEWAVKAYQTNRQELFNQIERYNRIDVDGNLVVVRYIRGQAGKAADKNFTWTDASSALLKEASRAATTREQVYSLKERDELLSSILGRSVSDLTEAQVGELEKVLDRTDYLEQRDRILDSEQHTADEKEATLQRLTHKYKGERKAALLTVFQKVSGKKYRSVTEDQIDSIADLFLIHRVDAYTVTTLHKMILLNRLLAPAKKAFSKPERDVYRRLSVPEEWLEKLKDLRDDEILKDLQLKAGDLRDLWIGLYYYTAFPPR